MRTLETTRVCVIDDEVDEYLQLIQALSRLRLGTIHIAGDRIEDLPEEPLSGLRLVFLDMQLGTEGDDAAITSHTARVFSRVVPSNAGPLLVVVWTKYKDIVEAFRKRLYEAYPEYQGKLLFTIIEKPVGGIPAQANELRESVDAEMRKFYPAELLWRWEQLVHDAASATTEEISRHATQRAKITDEDSEEAGTAKLLKGLSEVLRILISAEAEETISSQTAFADLLAVLIPLHRDRLEHAVEREDAKVAEALVGGPAVVPTSEEKVELNTMLIVAPYLVEDTPFRPGVICAINNNPDFEARFRISIPEVFGEILDVRKTATWNKLKSQSESGNLDIARGEQVLARFGEENAKLLQQRDGWLGQCVPILLDISPLCDFAQGNSRLARLMMGLMVPSGGEIKYHAKGAFQKLPTVKVPDHGATGWDLVFCSRFVFSFVPTAAAEEVRPICRLRDSIVAELRGWAAAQDARGGHVSVH